MRDDADFRCDDVSLGEDKGGIGRLVDVVRGIHRTASRDGAKVKRMVVCMLVIRKMCERKGNQGWQV